MKGGGHGKNIFEDFKIRRYLEEENKSKVFLSKDPGRGPYRPICLEQLNRDKGENTTQVTPWGLAHSLQLFCRSRQLLLTKFFSPNSPSMRKVDLGEKKQETRNNDVYSGHLRRCQLTDRTPTDRNAKRICH